MQRYRSSAWKNNEHPSKCTRVGIFDHGSVSEAHFRFSAAINRVAHLHASTIATGDDDGVIKLWDTRQSPESKPVRSYSHHTDFISDFLWLPDKKQLIATRSAEANCSRTLSNYDHLAAEMALCQSWTYAPIRHNRWPSQKTKRTNSSPSLQSKGKPIHKYIQNISPCARNAKIVVGTQLGVLSIWDRKKGWADCVDRFVGHPQSIDAIAPLTPDVVVTGSSDGLIRVVQVLPNKLLGVIADHGEFPVERLKVDRNGKWLASASHDEVLKMTDIADALEESDEEEEEADAGDVDSDPEVDADTTEQPSNPPDEDRTQVEEPAGEEEEDNDSDVPEPDAKKKRRKKDKRKAEKRTKTEGGSADASFFSGL